MPLPGWGAASIETMKNQAFIKGVDISFLEQQLAGGAVFKDGDGNPMDIYALLKAYGVNGVRFRVWNEPENVPASGGYCTIDKTIAAAKAAKDAGMHFLLDYHYSDFWADPGQQNKPKAWENLPFAQLVGAVYDFTYATLLQCRRAGVLPDMVQVGNEIRNGMLWDDGILQEMITAGDASHHVESTITGKPTNWGNLAKLVNAGLAACKAMGVDTMIHLDEGANFALLESWFDNMRAHGLDDFDAIGVSYYAHFHGKIEGLEDAVNGLAAKYAKPVYIAEVAHPWRMVEGGFTTEAQLSCSGFDAAIDTQKAVLDQVFQIAANAPGGLGRGVYYWEPVILPERAGYAANMGLFDEDGRALPGLTSFRFAGE